MNVLTLDTNGLRLYYLRRWWGWAVDIASDRHLEVLMILFVTRKNTSKCKYSFVLLVHFWTNDKLSQELRESLTLTLITTPFQFVPTAALLGFLSSRAWPSSPPFSMPFFFSSKDSITSSTSPPPALISRPSSSWPASFCCSFLGFSLHRPLRRREWRPSPQHRPPPPQPLWWGNTLKVKSPGQKYGIQEKMITFFIPGAFFHLPSTKNL